MNDKPAGIDSSPRGIGDNLNDSFNFRNLIRQLNTTSCTAYSLINGLKLVGCLVTEEQAEALNQSIITSISPLSREQQNLFAEKFGFHVRNILPFSEKDTEDIQSLVDKFSTELERGPILISISTNLSKRDRLKIPEVSWENPKNSLGHNVVIVKEQQIVYIVDPYDPSNSEVFNVEEAESKKKLVCWLLSSLS